MRAPWPPSSGTTAAGPAGFHAAASGLQCDGVLVASIVEAAGTPAYIYSAGTIRVRYRAIDAAFGSYPHALHYAMKANSTLGIVRLMRGLGSAADANSGGEIELALRAGFAPGEIVFTGVGKTPGELERAVALGLKAINAESPGELDRIDAIAQSRGTRARVAIRINPDIDPESHPHISTGLKSTKFGVSFDEAGLLCREAAARTGLELVGLHVHVGSQIMTVEPIRRAALAVVALARELRDAGIRIEHLDVGGGLGISYHDASAPSIDEYAAAVLEVVRSSGLTILLEPGRVIVGPAGILVARVVDIKAQPDHGWFIVVDAGMTDLLRPALYGAYHRIAPLVERPGPEVVCDIVGPVCESSDTLGKRRPMPRPEVGDLMVIYDTGAYGSVMASNYNRRPTAVEVLVDAGQTKVIRRRQTLDELFQYEE